jgi:surfactin synthase thioesterase subunit
MFQPRDITPAWCPDWAQNVEGGGCNVICLPYAGGSASAWFGWQTSLGPDVSFFPYELPGRGCRYGDDLPTSRRSLVERIAEDLRPLASSGSKLVLMGHSMGATLAYEVALELGMRLPLILSGRAAPGFSNKNIHGLSDSVLIKRLAAQGGTSAEILENQELMDLILPVFRSDLQLLHQEQERAEFYDGPVLILGGIEDLEVPQQALDCWRSLCPEAEIRLFQGGHFFVQEQAECVQAHIRVWLARQ